MAAVEDKLLGAIRVKASERRGQRERLAWITATAGSYALDVVFLALFALAGSVPGTVALAYGAGAAATCLLFGVATARGWNLRLRDPGMVAEQNLCGLALQFLVLYLAPQIAFPWLANLMTVFAFSMIWLPVRVSVALWVLCTAASGALFYLERMRLGFAASGGVEAILAWAYFSLVLGRCVFLSVYATSMRTRLAESRRKLAHSLEQIQELVSFDELTKVLNRRSLIARLEQERAGAERTRQPFCVALMDLDHFKAVNDEHGHAAGDEVLKGFARAVHATMRDTDIFGRYGGEEFLMILTDTGLDGARVALERVRAAVARADWSQAAPGAAVTVSIGAAAWKAGEDTSHLLARADAALYRAKHDGRNRVEAP